MWIVHDCTVGQRVGFDTEQEALKDASSRANRGHEVSIKSPEKNLLEEYRERLRRYRDDPGFVAYMLRDLPEIVACGLDDLAAALASERWGCSYNDVVGLLDLFEKAMGESVERD